MKLFFTWSFYFLIQFCSATPCQLAYVEADSERDGEYIPQCTEIGEYEKIQCLNGNVGECWCVNEDGEELAGTRQKGKGKPDCENGKKKLSCVKSLCKIKQKASKPISNKLCG